MKYLKSLFIIALTIILSGCSVFGHESVEIAPYTVLKKQDNFELRHYEQMILVTTSMDGLDDKKSPFYKLFGYISGDNDAAKEIPMTAPVFMDNKDTKMETMSFVLPKDYALDDSPVPIDSTVKLEEIKDYTVATITFKGRLTKENIKGNRQNLESWIKQKAYEVTGAPKVAGYNPPFTIPAFRRNEVLISVKKPEEQE